MRERAGERAERQFRERMAFYDHLAARTQAAKDLQAQERLYHLVRVNDRTGDKTYLTDYPDTHKRVCRLRSKGSDISRYPHLRDILEEAKQPLDK